MSRGIGKRQAVLLQALASLDAEHPEHYYFAMSAIVTRLYSLSPDLQDREQQLQDYWTARIAELDAGDEKDRRLSALTQDLLYLQSKPNRLGRKRERAEPGRHGKVIPVSVEDDVNPSRCMRSLERRGLVRGGRGWFGLTALGRDKCKIHLSEPVKTEEPMPT
jgi:hypothetical protein